MALNIQHKAAGKLMKVELFSHKTAWEHGGQVLIGVAAGLAQQVGCE